ncbi:MAG: ISL3 family transposase [Polyangiaceae bacterium]
MRTTTLLLQLLGLKQTRIIGFEFTATELLVDVEPAARTPYCGRCGARCSNGYDQRARRWRHVDMIGLHVVLRYGMRRVDCASCGVTTELVPWAEPMSPFTRMFDELVAYFAQGTDKTTVSKTMGIAWRSVGNIIQRVVARLGPKNELDGLTHIGIDELSVRKHHQYITVVTDHLTGNIVWAAPGKNAATLKSFFEALGAQRAGKLEVVTIDMSAAYISAVESMAPQARLVFDRFHVQRLAHDALDQVRRAEVRELKGTPEANELKQTRFPLQKSPWNLTALETEKVALVQERNQPLYRAYLLKETLAAILDGRQVNVARRKLAEWVDWAARSRLEPFAKVARTISKHMEGIVGYVATRLSNGRIEGNNGKIRTITRRSYGFADPSSVIALIHLCFSGIDVAPRRRYPIPTTAST